MTEIKNNSQVSTQIPVIFQNVAKYEKEDSRFLEIKIWLMHTGVNFNGSSFSKEAVEAAIPTLANTPILAFIEENSAGEQDFSDHRIILHRSEDGELDLKYKGSAVGTIPETNNAHWETRVTDSGESKEYLVVDGLMWNKWGDPTDIMNRKGETSQSMELAQNYTGSFDKDGVFHFETFSFYGACLLGDDVLPAMQNSTVEVQFSTNQDIQNTIESKLQEFYTLFSQEGGNTQMEEVTNVEETEVVEVAEAETTETESNEIVFEAGGMLIHEDGSAIFEGTLEINEELIKEEFTEAPASTEITTEVAEVVETVEVIQEFTLTAQQLQNQIRNELSKQTHVDRWGDTCRNYWYVDHTESVAIFEDTQNGYQLHQASYILIGDNVEIQFESSQKVKIEYVPFEGESASFSSNFERFESEKAVVQSQLDELASYKRQREESDVKAKFADKLSEEEFTQVFESMKEAEIQDVEDKLFAIYGKKNFSVSSTKSDTPVNKVKLALPKEQDEISLPYGGLFEKFNTKENQEKLGGN